MHYRAPRVLFFFFSKAEFEYEACKKVQLWSNQQSVYHLCNRLQSPTRIGDKMSQRRNTVDVFTSAYRGIIDPVIFQTCPKLIIDTIFLNT